MLAKPLAQWRTYLHPSQRDAAFRDYNGPARVTGGAGTGKTVVAIHRAALLADQSDVRRQARSVHHLHPQPRPSHRTRPARTRRARDTRAGRRAQRRRARRTASCATKRARARRSPTRTYAGWPSGSSTNEGSSTAAEFLTTSGNRLSSPRRVIHATTTSRPAAPGAVSGSTVANVPRCGRRSKTSTASSAERASAPTSSSPTPPPATSPARTVKPYRHVVVDEAQDLHEAQWRLLRAAVRRTANDMFIVGDSHQRIYDRRSSLRKVGIKIVGRSKKLRINYRTTHEILRFGLHVLGEAELRRPRRRHRHPRLRRLPLVPPRPGAGASSERSPRRRSTRRSSTRSSRGSTAGCHDDDIAVCARSGPLLEGAAQALKAAGRADVPTRARTSRRRRCAARHDAPPQGPRVPVRGDHRLRRRHHASSLGPHPIVDDPVQRNHDLQRERCLLYVAATRARDGLWVGWSGKRSRFLMTRMVTRDA